MVVTLLPRVSVAIFLHKAKAFTPILVTLFGIFIDCNEVHSLNASSSIVVTLSEIVTVVKFLHSLNNFLVIVVRLLGKLIESKDSHSRNDSSFISVTLSGITIVSNAIDLKMLVFQ